MAFSFTRPHFRSILGFLLAALLFPLSNRAAPPLEFVTGGCRQIANVITAGFTTINQQDISHFTYYHSSDGKHFEEIYVNTTVEDHLHPGSYSTSFQVGAAHPEIRSGWNHFRVTAHDSDGLYYLLFQDSVYYTLPSTPVFPGDCNSDGRVNSWDFVALCSALGETGPVRPNATTAHTLQPAPDWGRAFYDGADYKHADCNGDGVINLDDAWAIRDNYGDLIVNDLMSGCGALALRLVYPDSAAGGDTVNVEIWLGEEDNPVPNAYGFVVGFACHSDNLSPTFLEFALDTSFLGTPGQDLVVFSKDELLNEGWCDIAVSRTDGQERNGTGRVACLSIVMVDDIAKDDLERLLAPRIQTGLVLTPSLRDVSWTGHDTQVEGSAPEVEGVGPTLLSEDEVRFYPNPFEGYLVLDAEFDSFADNTKTLELYDSRGALVHQSTFTGNRAHLKLDFLIPGTYMAKVHAANKTTFRRLVRK